jgi:hypothetical protein
MVANHCQCTVQLTLLLCVLGAASQVVPGPDVDSINVLRLVTNTWNMWHITLTTRPVFAPQLAAPRQVFNQLQYKTGVLVQAISTCASFEVRPLNRCSALAACGSAGPAAVQL